MHESHTQCKYKYVQAQWSTHRLSLLSSVLLRKEVTHESKQRETKVLYMLQATEKEEHRQRIRVCVCVCEGGSA